MRLISEAVALVCSRPSNRPGLITKTPLTGAECRLCLKSALLNLLGLHCVDGRRQTNPVLQRTEPGRFADRQVRTLQRRIKRWRTEGPGKEVYFAQQHQPG